MVKSQGDGILNSLTNRYSVTILFFAVFSISCIAQPVNKFSSCVEEELNTNVVRMDERNHRLFLADKTILASDLKDNLYQIARCFDNTTWNKDWALSVFSETKYAGYKDEETIIPYHKDNRWAQSYRFEYDHQTRTLTLNPATKPEKILLQ